MFNREDKWDTHLCGNSIKCTMNSQCSIFLLSIKHEHKMQNINGSTKQQNGYKLDPTKLQLKKVQSVKQDICRNFWNPTELLNSKCVVYWELGLWYRPNWVHIESGENPRGVGIPEGRVQGANGGQRESVYEQPRIEVDDSYHSWREPSK
jgi:hypothetical protein